MGTWVRVGAVDVGYEVADRVTRPELVDAVSAHRGQTESLATGELGNALLSAVLRQTGPNRDRDRDRDRRGRASLVRGMRGLTRGDGHLGLHFGVSGAIAATTLLSQVDPRYQPMVDELDRTALPVIRAAARRLRTAPDLTVSDYDVVSGAAGWTAALSLRRPTGEVSDTLRELASGLAAALDHRDGKPRLRVRAEHLEPVFAGAAPGGCEDFGLAHGTAGVLTALALLVSDGLVEPTDDVLRGLDWGVRRLEAVAVGLDWPSMLLHGRHSAATPLGAGSRWGWCYGTPGVAWALWTAGRALGVPRIQDLAVDAMRLGGPASPDSPTLCHGLAGVLLLTDAFARATGDRELRRRADELVDEVLGHYDPDLPFGFRDVENHGGPVDNPGLLNGAAGVSLALLTVAGRAPRNWLRLFLLD